MTRPLYSKDMFAAPDLNFKPTVKQNGDSWVARRGPLKQNKRKTPASKPFFPTLKSALRRTPLSLNNDAHGGSGAGCTTPPRTPTERRSTKWPGMFRTGTPDKPVDIYIPPWNDAFENLDELFGPDYTEEEIKVNREHAAEIMAEDYRHMVCNPKLDTPKPWRDGLMRQFDSIDSDSAKRSYIFYYSLGYNEGVWPVDAIGIMEQAYLFGAMEKGWDTDIGNSLYRFYNGISDDGDLKGVRHYFHGDLEAVIF
ncbi:hypothetical protein TWF730_002919 [Orbilia blumenaviensis]|uniref:Uncharacterized protein n=1 Tax=Orbilia blumenaviensis TaxID=1796055 RepID=A0AAV9UAG7_9PEZI